jgi:hypothetical protein
MSAEFTDAARFVVRRIIWYADEISPEPYLRRVPRTEVVATFADHEAAVRDCRTREAEVRSRPGVNPFQHGGGALFSQTSFPAPVLCDWLLDHGFEPPPLAPDVPHADWVAWWDLFSGLWTAEQRALVYEALDKVRFFEVAEESAANKAYVVLEINWTWNDQPWLDADAEGGSPLKAFSSRAKAEAHCEQLNRQRRAEQDPSDYDRFCYEGRLGEFVTRPTEEASFYEVVEIDVEADREPESVPGAAAGDG